MLTGMEHGTCGSGSSQSFSYSKPPVIEKAVHVAAFFIGIEN